MPRYTRSDLRGARLHWLLSVTVRGRVWRFSEADLAITDGSERLHYAGGLESASYLDQAPEPGGAAESNSASIEITFAGEDSDGWAALVRASRGIGAARGELSLIREGDPFSSREVLLEGLVDDLSYGAYTAPISFVIDESPWDVRSPPFPPPSAAVSAATWPRAANAGTHQIGEGVEGMVYPIVFGAPGRGPSGRRFPAVPALLVEIDSSDLDNSATAAYVLVAGHRATADGVTNAVRLYNETTGTDATYTPSTVLDRLGREVTIVTVSSSQPIDTGDELWCSYGAPAAGGLAGPRGGATLRRADNVLAYLLGRSGARHLGGALAQIDSRLSHVLDFVHNDPSADPLDVFRQILGYLPASYRVGPEGLEVFRWPYDADQSDALAHIDPDLHFGSREAGPQLSRVSAIENTITANFSANLMSGKLIGRTVYAPKRRAGDTDIQPNPWAAASASIYGDRSGRTIELPHIAEPSVASAILDFLIQTASQQREYVTYSLPQDFQAIRPGSVVTVTDTDILWTDRLCVVLGVERRPGSTTASLVTLPNWVRDATV